MSALHDKLGKSSYYTLPEWERNLWSTQKEHIARYCFMPDEHLSFQLEAEKEKRLSKYCVLPNGKPVPHGPCGEDYGTCIFANYHSRKVRKYVISYYLKKMIKLLTTKSFEEAAKFGGVLGHYLQDGCCPGHVLNNLLLNKLFPATHEHSWHYHRRIDSWPYDENITKPLPELLGTSVEEAIFNLCAEYDKATALALSKICPFILAIQENNQDKANLISNEINYRAILLTGSAWHTAFCIAFKRFDKEECARLDKVYLNERVPISDFSKKYSRESLQEYGIKFYNTTYHEADPARSILSNDPYPFEPIANMSSDGKGGTFPLSLNVIKNGNLTEAKFKKGFATGGTSMLIFEAPGNIFSEFAVLAGIHPLSPKNSKASFTVLCEQEGKKKFGNKIVSANESCLKFKVPLARDCKTVSMIVTEGSPGTHAVWAEPILIKRH